MIIKNGTKLNGIPVDSTSILGKGRVVPNITITPTKITVHNTSNPNATAENHRKFLLNHNKADAKGAVTSWHFTVGENIVQHLDTLQMGYHAGTTAGNKSSIGIEVTEYTDKKKQAKAIANAKVLIRYLMNQHKITLANVVTHKSWTGKDCPRVILREDGGFEGFKKSIPATITINGTTATAKATTTATTVAKTVAETTNKYTFKATDKHIGVVEIVYNGLVNIREKADLTSNTVKRAEKGDAFKVYAIVNGLYKVGENFITSNSKYVKYYDNPFLDDKGKSLASKTASTSGVTSTKAITKKLKVKVDSLFVYNTADWKDKGTTVNTGEVFTVVKELVVDGAKMYQLKSGLFITASDKYVELV